MSRKNHRFGIVLKSEKTKAETFEDLQKSLDVAVLNDAGVYIMAWDWNPSKTNGKPGGDRSESGLKIGLSALISKAPGLAAALKKYSWKQLYIGFAATVVILTLIGKLIVRYLF